jgi:CBS domain-containing protein
MVLAVLPNPMSSKTKALSEKLSTVAHEAAVCIEESAKIGDALELMRERGADCVLVCRGGKLAGIFTERDYLMKVAGLAKASEPVSKFMTPNPVVEKLNQTVGEAVEIMNDRMLRHLPLVDGKGAPAGVVTVDAVIDWLAGHYPAAVVNRPPDPHIGGEETDGA